MEIYLGSVNETVEVYCSKDRLDPDTIVIDKVCKDGKDLCLDTLKALGILDEIVTSAEEKVAE